MVLDLVVDLKGRVGVFTPQHLPAKIDKHFVDVCPCSCARLVIWGIPPLRQGERFASAYGALVLEIGLVADNDNWRVFVVLDPNNFVTEHRQLGKRRW